VPQGRIKWFSQFKGFGMITKDEGGDIFFKRADVRATGFRSTLVEGQRVSFEVKLDLKGPKAVNVRALF